MKLSRFFPRVMIMILVVFLLAACAPPQAPAILQRAVQLPDPLRILIESLSVFVVGWVFAQIGARLPWFVKLFGQYADEIAFAISGAVIGAIQTWLNLIPPGWETVGNLALALLVAIFAALQLFRLLGKLKVKTFRA